MGKGPTPLPSYRAKVSRVETEVETQIPSCSRTFMSITSDKATSEHYYMIPLGAISRLSRGSGGV